MNPAPQGDNGLCEPLVAAWFREYLPDATQGLLEFERIAGGRSNLTYSVSDEAGSRWVLRRPPLGIRHASAHDVIREADILERLQNVPVPSPIVVGKCIDESVTGAPFFVMDFIDGAVLRDPEVVRAKIPYETRAGLAAELVRNLAALHSVDPREIGWNALADRTDYIDRQLNRWLRNWKGDRVRDSLDLERTHAKLSRNIPPQCSSSVVHGDFRLDNCIVGADGVIAGILDWELATVGDPWQTWANCWSIGPNPMTMFVHWRMLRLESKGSRRAMSCSTSISLRPNKMRTSISTSTLRSTGGRSHALSRVCTAARYVARWAKSSGRRNRSAPRRTGLRHKRGEWPNGFDGNLPCDFLV